MAARSLRGARLLVTGASAGIGRSLAVQASQRGAKLVVTARRRERLEAVAEQIADLPNGEECICIAGDVTDPAHRAALADCCREQGLDVLVNNAGLGAIGPFADADAEQLRRVMEVNFFAPVELTRLLLPLLAAPGACRPAVAIVGSVLSLAAVPLKADYCASKFAVHGWAESLRAEVAAQGIDVLELHPSTTESEFFDNVLGDSSLQKSVGAMTPEAVAARILRGIERGRPESVFPFAGKALVALRRWAPPLYRLIMKRTLQS